MAQLEFGNLQVVRGGHVEVALGRESDCWDLGGEVICHRVEVTERM